MQKTTFKPICRLRNFCRGFYQWLHPSYCEACHQIATIWITPSVCLRCWSILYQPPPVIAIAPGVNLISFGFYQGFWRKHLIRAKFKQDIFSYHILHKAMEITIATSTKPLADITVSIPSHRLRSYVRGGNIIKHFQHKLAKDLGIPIFYQGLQKTRSPKRQSKTPHKRARFANIKSAFCAPPNIAGKNILLFDDVCTTGATLKEAIRALSLQHPKSITCITLLRSRLEV